MGIVMVKSQVGNMGFLVGFRVLNKYQLTVTVDRVVVHLVSNRVQQRF